MNKTYKGWEILKMTEEGKFKEGDRIHNDITVYKFDDELWIDMDDVSAGVEISEFIGQEFEIITKPVTFMEAFTALQSNKNIRVEHNGVKHFKGNHPEDYLFSESDISKGVWYIEE
ncbi:hypothetical protein FDJ70_05815 [Clostridium botulinum]|nr:hypothetical protein [Clostridium botulinum]